MKLCKITVIVILQNLLNKREFHEKPVSNAHTLFKDISEWPTTLSIFIDRLGRDSAAQMICTQCRRAVMTLVTVGADKLVLYIGT
jgi:hypothetical protein